VLEYIAKQHRPTGREVAVVTVVGCFLHTTDTQTA